MATLETVHRQFFTFGCRKSGVSLTLESVVSCISLWVQTKNQLARCTIKGLADTKVILQGVLRLLSSELPASLTTSLIY